MVLFGLIEAIAIKKFRRGAFLYILIIASQFAFAETYSARVVGISDGDTITVLDNSNTQHKIRLAGIDAPEKSQAFGQRSKESLSAAVFGKHVLVESKKYDKYDRAIGKVIFDGQDVNLKQIRLGLAWHYKAYEKEQSVADRAAYGQAEAEARSRQVGLWRDSTPIPPWDFRHGTGNASPKRRVTSGEACPCGGAMTCTGPKGGIYCITTSGGKRYR